MDVTRATAAARRILRTPEAAIYIGIKESTLEKARITGDGPPFVRLGARSIGYDIRALDTWIEERTAESTSHPREERRAR